MCVAEMGKGRRGREMSAQRVFRWAHVRIHTRPERRATAPQPWRLHNAAGGGGGATKARACESEWALVRHEPANPPPPPTPPPTGTVLGYNGNIFFYRLISPFLIVADDCRRIGRV